MDIAYSVLFVDPVPTSKKPLIAERLDAEFEISLLLNNLTELLYIFYSFITYKNEDIEKMLVIKIMYIFFSKSFNNNCFMFTS